MEMQKEKEKEEEGKKMQGRDGVRNPNGHPPAYRATTVGRERGWGSQDPLVLCHEGPTVLTSQRENLSLDRKQQRDTQLQLAQGGVHKEHFRGECLAHRSMGVSDQARPV